jgi:hypothetical protein
LVLAGRPHHRFDCGKRLFASPERRSYDWRRSYSARAFAEYLGTRSDYALLPDDRRLNLLHAVEAALPDQVEIDWLTNLYIGRKWSTSSMDQFGV